MRAVAIVIVALASACQRAPMTTAPHRALAARLSYAALDRWRPLDGGAAREPIALAAFDALDRRGDQHGVADLALLADERGRAADRFARAPHTPDVDADRAVLALVRGDVAAALEQLDAVLAAQPRHAQALWNRGLALAALDLPLAAAQSFAAVAALGEPGWRDEARTRAAALQKSWDDRVAAAAASVSAGKAMVGGGPPIADALARRFASHSRHYLYHAVRAAPSLARLDELRPLARTLDAVDGDDTLGRWLERVRAEAPAVRARLGPRYGGYVLMSGSPSPKEQDQFLAELRRTGADDLRLGALVLFDRTAPADLDELRALVARNDDPWWPAALARAEARALSNRGDLDGAARLLAAALERCQAHKLDYRSADLAKQLALVDEDRHRTSDARRSALVAVRTARDLGINPRFLETSTIFLLGEIARYRNDFALMRAYLGEGLLRVPDNCEAQRHAHLMLGIADVFAFAFDDAARQLAATPRCSPSFPLLYADLVTSLQRAGRDSPATATLAADLAAARPSLTPGQAQLADVLQARLVIERDRDAGLALLRRVLAEPRRVAETDAKKARTMAYQTLAIDDGRRGDFGGAVDALAAEAEAPPGRRCALAVALDDARAVIAARGSNGASAGHYEAARPHPDVDAAHLVPPAVRRALAGCAEVAVFALAPVHGEPELLPPELAWSYRMGPSPSQPAASTLPPRRLVVSDVVPPPSLNLPRLAPWTFDGSAVWLSGADATPARVLGELGDATEIELNAHGLIDLDRSDTWLLVLSPDGAGQYALTAAEIERQRLRGRPLVVLGACSAGRTAPYLHEPWSLPMAFIDAGARAVFASAAAIPDARATRFFDAVLARVHAGQSPATALRDERVARMSDDPTSWTRHVLLFE